MMTKNLQILLVEDNPGDVLLIEEALNASGTDHRLRVAGNGTAALENLRREASAHDLPDLVILDLNLPGMSGHEILETIKCDPVLGCLPVLVLSSSKADADVLRSYELHSSCHVAKPVDLDGYLGAVGAIEDFWSATVQLPVRNRVR